MDEEVYISGDFNRKMQKDTIRNRTFSMSHKKTKLSFSLENSHGYFL